MKPIAVRIRRVQWFARTGLIARMGPFESQVEAVERCRLLPVGRWEIAHDGSTIFPARTGDFYDNTFVWPEEVPVPAKPARKGAKR